MKLLTPVITVAILALLGITVLGLPGAWRAGEPIELPDSATSGGTSSASQRSGSAGPLHADAPANLRRAGATTGQVAPGQVGPGSGPPEPFAAGAGAGSDATRPSLLPLTPPGLEAALRAAQADREAPPTLGSAGSTDAAAQAQLLELMEAMLEFTAGHGEAYEEWLAMISEVVGPADAAFLHETLFAGHDWDTVRALLDERRMFSGHDYRELMMGLGLTSGDISLQQINALIDAGVPLPEMSGYLLASRGRVEDMIALAQRGQIGDLHMRDPLFGDTAAGALVDHLRSASGITAPAAVAKLQAVLDLGVEPSQRNGSQDLLTRIMISTTPENAEVMVTLARHLLSSGTVVTPAHRAIIARSPASPLRDLYEYVLNNP